MFFKKTKFPKDHPEYLTQEERAKRFGITVYDIRALDSETSWAHLKTENSKTDEELKEIRENLVVRKEKNRYKNWTQEMFEDAKEVFLKHENLLKREDGCFDWTGQSNTFAIFGVQFYIKPIACSLKYKTHKPKDFYTKNICDYNGCCNPEHLIFVKNGREITEEEFQDSVKNGNIPENVEKVIVKTHRKGLKLSIEKAEDIRIQVHLKGASIKEMCEKYDVHNTVINDIVKNKKWKIDEQEFLEKYLNCSVYVGKKITREIAEEIRKLYSLGNTTYQKLADLYDCSVANIQKIIKFETFK